jgi:hypothetical protein
MFGLGRSKFLQSALDVIAITKYRFYCALLLAIALIHARDL